MKPAVEMWCTDCGTELLIPYQAGKARKDRKTYCKKCMLKIKEANK